MTKVHVINDESLGGIEREYIEVDRKAEVGDYVVITEGNPSLVYKEVGEVVKIIETNDDTCDGVLKPHDYGDKGAVYHFQCKTLEPTNIVHIDGVQYQLVDRQAEVGEKVLIINAEDTFGKYGNGDTIVTELVDALGIYNTSARTTADGDNPDGLISHGEYRILELVTNECYEESCACITESDTSPQVIDMLANLSRRIVSLEQQLRDTQRNVETLAQDIEVAKYGQDDLAHVEADVDEASLHDVVNHPAHYNAGKYEVIDVITDVTEQLAKAGASGPECYAIGNVLKYVMRYRHKNGEEDLRKAKWYIDKAVEEMLSGQNR